MPFIVIICIMHHTRALVVDQPSIVLSSIQTENKKCLTSSLQEVSDGDQQDSKRKLQEILVSR